MADKPIIFSAPMIRALLCGRKTQTRRILKPQPEFRGGCGDYHDAEEWGWEDEDGYHVSVLDIAPNGFRVGDRLWVREAHAFGPLDPPPVIYRATAEGDGWEVGPKARYRPSIHMPRWASRLTLIVTDVRVQRLQEISEADAVAEGAMVEYGEGAEISHRRAFNLIWNSLHGPEAWGANPWVVALTFTVTPQNIDSVEASA